MVQARSAPATATAADPPGSPSPLGAWPRVAFELRARGVTPERANGEDEEAFANRIGTRLMALYRDTRSGESFDALYAFARPAVLRWIQSLVARGRSPLDPVELLQDTFVNVYRYPGSFREEHAGSFRVWVRTIAGNLVRRSSSARSRVSLQELPEGLQEPADPREGPEARVARAEALGCLRSAWVVFLSQYARAWEGLAQRDRRALHLVEVEGQSYERAGEILRVGRSNMKMIVFRARKRIARRMRAAMAPAAAAGRAEGAGTFASRARAGRATGGRSALAGPDGRGLARTSGVA